MEKIPLIAVVGPTASGKTSAGIELAKKYESEVVSADSMQIYKGMPIAAAVPTEIEKQGIKHHLMEFLDLNIKFTVADYKALADEKIKLIHSQGKIPIMVGGTGLYIDSVVNNISYCEEKKVGAVREKLLKQADLMGMQYMHDMLYLCDEETAKRLHVNDKKRILRALEIFELHGKSMSEMMVLSRQNPSPYKAVLIGIAFRDRQKLYDRIDRRVDNMLENGLLEEARQAYESKNRATSAQAIGHKELFKYFEGNATLEAAAEHLKMQTRRYAKRQMTWFKKNDNIKWIYADEQDVISEALKLSEEVFG